MISDTADAIVHSPELLAFAQRQVRLAVDQAPPATERREVFRVPIAVSAIVQAVDETLTPLGAPVAAATRDVTKVGVGLILECGLDTDDQLAVQFSIDNDDIYLLAEVLWCKPMAPYYYVGLRAVKALDHMPRLTAD